MEKNFETGLWYGFHRFEEGSLIEERFFGLIDGIRVKNRLLFDTWCDLFSETDLMYETLKNDVLDCFKADGRKALVLAISNFVFRKNGCLKFSTAERKEYFLKAMTDFTRSVTHAIRGKIAKNFLYWCFVVFASGLFLYHHLSRQSLGIKVLFPRAASLFSR